MKNFINLLIAAILGSFITISVLHFTKEKTSTEVKPNTIEEPTIKLVSNNLSTNTDFTLAAEKVMDGVVHITSISNSNTRNYNNPFQQSEGNKMGSGSGVIISNDGHIVTNNHVIDGASELEITLHDNRIFKAKVIGTDPSTDLALIKIEANDLKTIEFVNSDDIKVGEWVLAVGNPFNLNSTVTAGIISAKSRNIRILRDRSAIESFIQTDAAVNPGNSGGALVDLNGGLVGINSAIASPTGSYTGYSFAIPSNLVKKIVEDLLEFGIVQRAYIGVIIRGVDAKIAQELDLDINEGVLVDELMENGSAAESGIKIGDVIVKIDEVEVKTVSELQEIIGRHRPGDKISAKINRKGKNKNLTIILKNLNGNTEIIKKEESKILTVLGLELEDLTDQELQKYRIASGVKVKGLKTGKIRNNTNMEEGFIITKISGARIKSVKDVLDKLSNKKGGVLFEGVYPGYSNIHYYGIGL